MIILRSIFEFNILQGLILESWLFEGAVWGRDYCVKKVIGMGCGRRQPRRTGGNV